MRLDRHHELFRTSVRAVLERLFLPELEDWEKAGEMPTHELYRSLGEEGLLGLTLPVDDGGLGLDLGYSHVWARELGRLPAGSRP